MIRAVTLDFWNTLYVEDPAALARRRDRRVALAQSFFAAAGKTLNSDAVRRALAAAFDTVAEMRVRQHRGLSHEEIGQAIAAPLGLRLSEANAELLARSVSSVGRDHPPAPADGAGLLLAALAKRVKVALVSDTGLTLGVHLRQVLESHGLAEFFDHCTFSDETLTAKPAARQFLYTLAMLDVRPEEAAHVGDLEGADIAGARAVGMKTIRIAPGDAPTAADARAANLPEVAAILRRWGLDVGLQ